MAFYSLDDPNLWGRDTKEMAPIAEAGGMAGISIANFFLGKPEDDAPVATVLRMDPGHVLPHHGHNCYRLEVVVQGSINVGDRILRPGSIMFSEPGVLYGPHIAGPEGCTTVEIFSNFKASHSLMLKGPKGLEEHDLWTKNGAQRTVELVTQQMAERGA
jgi:hypothetical protein